MKVMTFNIWNYTRPWKERRELIAGLIKHHKPDAVALQETRHDFRYERGKGQGEQLAEMTGYHATVAVGQVYLPILRVDEAVTILTLQPPKRSFQRELARLPRERDDENQRVCVGVLLNVNGRDVHVFDTHFSLSSPARMSNALEISRFIKDESEDSPAVLMGDLNAEPNADAIRFLHGAFSYAGETGDFFDCWTAAHPNDEGFTYASFEPVRRIDYVFARNLPASGIKAEIIGTESRNGVYPSDHLAIVVDLPL
jgi:endonuclease/exonuclease/phosphatase family metal-dependent hydrolase